MMEIRTDFAAAHPDVRLFALSDPDAIQEYLRARGLIESSAVPAAIERAGEGNMNLTLRVSVADRGIILKQGRPWVEKYDHIAAPWERTIVEATFYRLVAAVPAAAGRMPQLIDLDEHNHVLVLEDLGRAGDYTNIYADGSLPLHDLQDLLAWLTALAHVPRPESGAGPLRNRAMRDLNHEHMFLLPLRAHNGLDLDRVTPGLNRATEHLICDHAYGARVAELGGVYLADGGSLVHGDFFPGSWIRTAQGVRIIDPEFGFFGLREFDYGVLLAHCALARTASGEALQVLEAARQEALDPELVLGFAGVEVMRRLLGVAQLPLRAGLDAKKQMLELSRAWVLTPERSGASWW
jgi:5-methylthioribose kinase